jgi:hypothetical protein
MPSDKAQMANQSLRIALVAEIASALSCLAKTGKGLSLRDNL